jgi:hypothetical protein
MKMEKHSMRLKGKKISSIARRSYAHRRNRLIYFWITECINNYFEIVTDKLVQESELREIRKFLIP